MTIRAKLGNLFVRFIAGGTARLVALPRPSKRLMKSVARTAKNRSSLDKAISEQELYWAGVLESWNDASLLMAANMLARGNDPGLGDVFLRPATAALMLRELRRRWESEAADDILSKVKAESTAGRG